MPRWSRKSTDTTLSAIASTLSVINNAASLLSGVPGLKPAAEGALSLVKVIQKVRGNTERAIYLAEMVKNTVEQIYGSVTESHPNAINENLERDLKTLRETFLRIECKIEKQLKQKWYSRALKRDVMFRVLDECIREFDNAQQVFLVNSAIDLRQQVVAIVTRIDGRRLQELTFAHRDPGRNIQHEAESPIKMAVTGNQIKMGAAFFYNTV